MAPASQTGSACPPDAAFVELLEGRLERADADRLRDHVVACSACGTLLDELERGKTVLEGGTTVGERIARALLDETTLGETVGGKYRLMRLLGAGGMGAVYEAERLPELATVALKLIKARVLARGDEGPRRFRREARAAGAIDSPNIVRVLDTGEDGVTGNLFLVMEYLEGEDLQRLIDREGPLRPEAVVRIAAQALAGLVAAHAAGIVHRDIKPANLFLARGAGGETTVKLLDFGIAKILDDSAGLPRATALTNTGGLLGSPLYMSPEQVQNSKDVDHRTDLWSLGSTMYAALAGRAPHGHLDSVGALILAICGSPAKPLRELAPWVPAPIAAVVHRALSIDRSQRFPSAAAMLAALRALAPDGFELHADHLVGVASEDRAVAPSAPPPRRLRLAAGAAALVVAGLAVNAVRTRAPAPTSATSASAWTASSASTASPALPAPTAAASAAPAPSTTASAPAPRKHALLVVLPEDASVEVDGARATMKDGVVELTGALGSEHAVRVSKGARALATKVLITESGAEPPKVELPPGHLLTARSAPASAPTAAPSAAPKPPPPQREEDVMRQPE